MRTRLLQAFAALALAGCGGSDAATPRRVDAQDAAPDRAVADVTFDAAVADDVAAAQDAAAEDVAAAQDVAADDAPVMQDAAVDAPPAARDFSTPGPNAVAVWTGAIMAGADRVAVRAFYPTGAGAERYPLVAFAHGFQLQVSSYDRLLTHVATWGYVVVSVDYPGTLLAVDHRKVPAALTAARMAFSSGGVAGFPAGARVDGTRAVAMGHSLGGKGAIMALLDDAGFAAGLALDPVDDNPAPFGRVTESTPSIAPERMGGLRRPLGFFGATQSRCARLGQTCAPESSDYRQFAAAAPAGATLAVWPLRAFGHMDFVDPGCGFACAACAGGAAPLDSRLAAVRALSVAFLERFARGDATAQGYVDGAERASLVSSGVLWNGMPSGLPPCM